MILKLSSNKLFFISFVNKQSKLSKFFFLCLITLSSFFCFSDSTQAGNPTQYVTIHDPYTRVDMNKYPSSYSFGASLYYESQAGYIPYMRMFLPPGSISFKVQIDNYAQLEAMSRHHTPPTTPVPYGDGFVFNNSNTYLGQPYSLDKLEKTDCHSVPSFGGNVLDIARDYFSPTLELSRSGWLYIHIGDGPKNGDEIPKYIHFTTTVDPVTYNDWWDHGGSNPDESINWEKDVESVEDYQGKQKLTGDLDDDGDVDANDYSIFLKNYKNTDSDNPANFDGKPPVDANDYAIFLKNYTGSK